MTKRRRTDQSTGTGVKRNNVTDASNQRGSINATRTNNGPTTGQHQHLLAWLQVRSSKPWADVRRAFQNSTLAEGTNSMPQPHTGRVTWIFAKLVCFDVSRYNFETDMVRRDLTRRSRIYSSPDIRSHIGRVIHKTNFLSTEIIL